MTVFKKDNLLKEARNVDIKLILAYYNSYQHRSGLYNCLYHKDETPSASVKNNRYKCFSCGIKNSTIDIVMSKEHISDERVAAKRVLEISNKEIDIKTLNEIKNSNKKNNKKKTLSFDDRMKLTDFTNISKIEEYLKSRAISPKVLKVLDVNNIRYGVDRLNQINFFFFKGQFAIYRSLNDKNYNCGTPIPIPIKVNNSKQWYIVEGLFDALTLIDLGKNTICLNSVANVDKLTKLINIHNKNFEYIIATDTDESGFNALEKLSNFFNDNDIKYDVFDRLYGSGCKDINEMRIKGLL